MFLDTCHGRRAACALDLEETSVHAKRNMDLMLSYCLQRCSFACYLDTRNMSFPNGQYKGESVVCAVCIRPQPLSGSDGVLEVYLARHLTSPASFGVVDACRFPSQHHRDCRRLFDGDAKAKTNIQAAKNRLSSNAGFHVTRQDSLNVYKRSYRAWSKSNQCGNGA